MTALTLIPEFIKLLCPIKCKKCNKTGLTAQGSNSLMMKKAHALHSPVMLGAQVDNTRVALN